MHFRAAIPVAFAVFVCGAPHDAPAQTGDAGSAANPSEAQNLTLTPSQRRAIYDAVSRDKSKAAKPQFSARVGADVPPMIELYPLPERVLAENHTANFYEYTLVQDKVVLVDPTKMRVVDIIGPP
jgi:hypothetical protein